MPIHDSRRQFIKKSLIASSAIPFLGLGCVGSEEKENIKPLKILILGGTSFLGPHQISYALNRGHSISTFTRGKTKPSIYTELFDKVEQLIGDRENDLTALENKEWDVVIDNSGHNTEWTKKTAELLEPKVKNYLYTSSTGVFYPYLNNDLKESDPVLLKEPAEILVEEEKMEYWYGVMKAQSEQEAIKAFGKDRAIIVRPTYMMGPSDKTDRFIHWPIRLAEGGEVLVPGNANDPVQYIDVRDVAEWMIRLAETQTTGTYNAAGPIKKQGMRAFVEEAATAFDVEHTFVQIDDFAFLKEKNINYIVPWIMPEGNNYASARVNNQLAIKNGLTLRPLKTSVTDIHEWWYSDAVRQEHRGQVVQDPKGVLSREAGVIQDWKAKNQTAFNSTYLGIRKDGC